MTEFEIDVLKGIKFELNRIANALWKIAEEKKK